MGEIKPICCSYYRTIWERKLLYICFMWELKIFAESSNILSIPGYEVITCLHFISSSYLESPVPLILLVSPDLPLAIT